MAFVWCAFLSSTPCGLRRLTFLRDSPRSDSRSRSPTSATLTSRPILFSTNLYTNPDMIVSSYCFWCGCQYNDKDDLSTSCPGEDEQDH